MMKKCICVGNLVLLSRRASSLSKYCFSSHAESSVQQGSKLPAHSNDSNNEEYAGVDWKDLGFDLKPTDYMYVMKCSKDEGFINGQLSQYGNIVLSPSAGVLNYGQGLFEGLKVIRRQDGHLVLLRPEQNAIRMKVGADRMCMPSPSVDQFVNAVKQTALANRRWIPPPGIGFLYMRPLLLGTGAILGLAPAPEYTFIVYASPVRNYFKEQSSLDLFVEEEFDRASSGGTGGVKSITNYGPALRPLTRARDRGFSDVLYLDSVNGKYVEETSCCNIFIVKDSVISTPATNGTVLPGVTRKCIIDIACDHGYKVEERSIPVEELIEADEVFCTANAVGVAPVGSITYQGKRIQYSTDSNSVTKQLISTFVGIQNGLIEDKRAWIVEIS